MIVIKNLRNEKMKNALDIRVDRASILGNPCFMQDESMRNEVCEKYKVYFEEKSKTDANFQRALYNILATYKKYGMVNLFCWCYPKRCHAETIKEWLEKEILK